MIDDIPQPRRREVALAILTRNDRPTKRAAQFLGQCCSPEQPPLSAKQLDWFLTLAERVGVEVLPHD